MFDVFKAFKSELYSHYKHRVITTIVGGDTIGGGSGGGGENGDDASSCRRVAAVLAGQSIDVDAGRILSSSLLLLLRISAVQPLYKKYFRCKADSVSVRCSLAIAAKPALQRKLPLRRRPPPGKITLIDSMIFTRVLRF